MKCGRQEGCVGMSSLRVLIVVLGIMGLLGGIWGTIPVWAESEKADAAKNEPARK